jgi:hypothetical protein
MLGLRLILSFCTFAELCLAAEPRVYGVCRILDHLEDFGCRMVRVKARLVSDVGTWLAGEGCAKKVEVSEVTFQNLIALTWPSSRLAGCRVHFTNDADSRRKLEDVLSRYDLRTHRIDVVLDGVIETRRDRSALVIGSPPQKMGFGHLNAAPAQIIVKRVISIKVRRSKRPLIF